MKETEVSTNERPLAHRETREINILRGVVALLLVSIATAASVIVYKYAANDEKDAFQEDFQMNAQAIVNNFHSLIERKMGAINSLSTAITSYAIDTEQQFPLVTIPDFELRGCDTRIQADATAIKWMPLVDDNNRAAWENYTLWERGHADAAFEEDAERMRSQDEYYGLSELDGSRGRLLRGQKLLHDGEGQAAAQKDDYYYDEDQEDDHDQRLLHPPLSGGTVLGDGSGFHPHIWSTGSNGMAGDEPENSGPYLPLWQTSPSLSTRQGLLNLNMAKTHIFFQGGLLHATLATKEAIMGAAVIPLPSVREVVKSGLAAGQYRHNIDKYVDDPATFLSYPVFNSFDDDREIAGILSVSFYWNLFFSQSLPRSAIGYMCILENSYNQTMSFRIDGHQVTYLGEGDQHDERYDDLEESANVNAFVQSHASPQTRSYTTVPLNKEFGNYRLRIYPSKDTEDSFLTNRPAIYTTTIILIFLLTTAVLVCLDRAVVRRQGIVMERAVRAAQEAATAERDMNAFLAHEVRNPIAAAISAHGLIVSALNSNDRGSTAHEKTLSEDLQIIGSCLCFVDDFLRSILDLYRANANKIEIHLAKTNLLKDILEPVCSILYQRDSAVDVSIDCPENLEVLTDALRLKQVMMNLGRNSIKFTTSGFVNFRANVVDGLVELYISDSGCGIPATKRGDLLFTKFQTSLDKLNHGTGVGLALCKNLVELLKGDIYLDEDYDSGVKDSPGARFVVRLNAPPVPQSLESPKEEDSLNTCRSTEEESLTALPENLSALFVDDDSMLRRLFSRSLKKVAPTWRVKEAVCGEAALQLLEDGETFDVIFIDQYMSSGGEQVLLGTETTQRLRERGVQSTICGLSANDMEVSFLEAGADSFQLKPFPCKKEAMEKVLVGILQAGEHRTVP